MTDFERDNKPASLSDEAKASLHQMVRRAAHVLPTQGPLEAFVHHNSLHAFEELPFHEAVKVGTKLYGAEPYLSESEYRRLYTIGRIRDEDLEAAIQSDLGERASEQINGLGTRCEIRYAILRHPLHAGPDAELRWVVAETDALQRFHARTTQINRSRIVSAAKFWLQQSQANRQASSIEDRLLQKFGSNSAKWPPAAWESFSLHLLWRTCYDGVATFTPSVRRTPFVRIRDLLFHAIGEDTDLLVQEILIRFCAAFVDQGYSDWLLPNRAFGFFESFVELYSTAPRSLNRWMKQLPDELSSISARQMSAEESIEDSLQELGIARSDREAFITHTLLALGGWAGMINQLEEGVDGAVYKIPKGALVGMLAVHLILEKHAIRQVGSDAFGEQKSIAKIVESAQDRLGDPAPMNRERSAFILFQVAQMLGWTPLELQQLSKSDWQALSNEVETFNEFERRRMFHEAYERKYHHAALRAFSTHAARRRATSSTQGDRPHFQIVTCIDDREESFRRHLEESQPRCETFGAAGFFAVAMYYRGAADGFYKPLCPGVITPSHYIREEVGYSFEGVHRERAELRRTLGLASHFFHTRSRTFLGGILAGIVGSLATIPLVTRVLFPHLTSRIRGVFGSLLQPPPVTQLQLERHAGEPGPDGGHVGFTVNEMADIVIRLLQDIGLTKTRDFSRLFIVCGHGSSSLNNPHESAYCCGACAGKRGGPNARAFAEMANDWRVRATVAQHGITIPDDTKFVGAYHNTCDESVVFYDLDRLPYSHREDFEVARTAIEEARRRNAHERCRRFDSAPLDILPKEALRHVEARAQDISQARPEYNHATNALCIVGRRDWTRGLFLDRRAFLTSYDATQDDGRSSILLRILSAAIPVCAGINLEYYFSCVDFRNYGAGSKLPHNIVSLLGVMEGTSSDLRTGLHQQMVEIHEPMRMLFLVETTPDAMLGILKQNEGIARLCHGGWSHLAVIDTETSQIQLLREGRFEPFDTSDGELPQLSSSLQCYKGERDHLPFYSVAEWEEDR